MGKNYIILNRENMIIYKRQIRQRYLLLLVLLLILSFTSVNFFSSFPILNSQIERIIQLLVLIIICIIIRQKNVSFKSYHKVILVYILWAIIGVIRGIFKADCYWEYNQLTIGMMSLSLPLFIFIFNSPQIVSELYKKWLKLCIPAFFIFFYWVSGATQFYLSPIFLLSCFIPIIPKKWMLIICLLLIMMGSDFANRSQVIKVIICIFFSIIYALHKNIPVFFLKILNISFYTIPICFLYLGISGKYNIFADGLSSNSHQYITQSSNGEMTNLNADTRTFIYKEVIQSAIKHKYIIAGRTPALGNDSEYFNDITTNTQYQKPIRYMNELCHLNIFTWLGVIGVVLFSSIFLMSSWLAINHSNNFALKIIGCYIAFNWFYGWIENMNRFDISNIFLWLVIAMGYSKEFRSYTDIEFSIWIKSLFKF